MTSPLVEVQDQCLNRIIGIALVHARRFYVRSTVRGFIRERGLSEDLNHAILCAAVAAWRAGMDPDSQVREIRNLIQRELYRFYKEIGLHRQYDPISKKQGRGFEFREIPDPDPKAVVNKC